MLAEADQFDVLLIRDLDRFSRSLAIYASAVDDLVAAGVTLYEFYGDGTGIRKLDLDNEDGRALADIKAVFAQMEKAKTKRRVRQAKGARAKAGGHPGGKRPFGYQYPSRDPDPEAGAAPGGSGRGRCHPTDVRHGSGDQPAEDRLHPQRGGHRREPGWPVDAIHCGSGAWLTALHRQDPQRRVPPEGLWEWFDGQHEAIVDEDLWRRVNASRATKERRAGGRPMKSNHLLTRGLLRCGLCGSAMQPVPSYDGRPETYKCLGRQNHVPVSAASRPLQLVADRRRSPGPAHLAVFRPGRSPGPPA